MTALTNKDYYNILLEGYKEAFELYEAREVLSNDEGIEDCETSGAILHSNEAIKQLGKEESRNLTVSFHFQKEVTIYFLRFLERQQSIFEKDYFIERSDFYKRCLLSLNIKLNEWNKESIRVLRDLNDMNIPPDTLEFLEYFKHHIKSRAELHRTTEIKQIIQEEKLSLSQIALKYAYENESITENNRNEIAEKYKHTSGKKLMQHFTFYYDRSNRKSKPHPSYTLKTLNNKIKLFESVIKLLSEEAKRKAIDELRILKGFLVEFE